MQSINNALRFIGATYVISRGAGNVTNVSVSIGIWSDVVREIVSGISNLKAGLLAAMVAK